MNFKIVTRSARLMCVESLIGCNQQASSTMFPFTPSATPVTTELASTQIFILLPSMHQSPPTASDLHTLAIVSASTRHRETSLTSSSQFLVSALVWHLINAVATLSQLHTGEWPTSFPHRENMCRQVTVQVGVGDFWTLTSLFPSELVFPFPDLQTRNLSPVSQDLYRLIHNLQCCRMCAAETLRFTRLIHNLQCCRMCAAETLRFTKKNVINIC